MKKKANKISPVIPRYAVLPLLSCVCVNFAVYSGIGKLTASWKHYDFTLSFDRAVPLLPWFASVYIGCYLFWIVNYILIARQGKECCFRFVTADIMSRFVCAVFFLLLPTTNVRPELTGDGMWIEILRKIYEVDAPTNLFPSIHCLVSWFSYIGLRGRKNIPRTYRAFSCVFAVLVCVSTQVIKQHYIIDVFGGILLAEAAYYWAFHTNGYKWLEKIFGKISSALQLTKDGCSRADGL